MVPNLKITIIISALLFTLTATSQEKSITDLSFLIGTWDVREDNQENGWWEKCTRTVKYTLDSTYFQLDAKALSSTGKERTYRWYIHYNSKQEQFEMVSMFSNWYKTQMDILEWDEQTRTLTIRNKPNTEEYHERLGQMVFNEDFNAYTWTGENKYGNPDDPGIWKYVEKGTRIKN